MADPFKKVQAGEQVAFGAATWNGFIDAAVAEQSRRLSLSRDPQSQTRHTGIIRVRNDSGGALDRYSVVGLNGSIFTPSDGADAEKAFLRGVLMSGVTPDANHYGRFAVLLEPAPENVVVRAWADGVCQVRLNLLDVEHQFADITEGLSDYLTSDISGGAQILWCQADEGYGYGYDEGEQWAIVRIGAGSSAARLRPAVTTSSITAKYGTTPGTGTVNLYDWDGSDLSVDTTSVTVRNDYAASIDTATHIWVTYWSGTWWALTEDCS